MAISKATASSIAPAAKGDLVVGSATNDAAVLTVGANGTTLVADSAEATGLKWATPSSGGMTLISTTTLSGASTSISSIPSTYIDLYVVVRNFDPATDAAGLNMKFNSHTTYSNETTAGASNFGSTAIQTADQQDNGTSNSLISIVIPNYAGNTWKMAEIYFIGQNPTTPANYQFNRTVGLANLTSAIDTLVFTCSSGNFSGGTVLVYGVK